MTPSPTDVHTHTPRPNAGAGGAGGASSRVSLGGAADEGGSSSGTSLFNRIVIVQGESFNKHVYFFVLTCAQPTPSPCRLER